INNHSNHKNNENTNNILKNSNKPISMIERFYISLKDKLYEELTCTYDYVTFSIPISRYRVIGYNMSSGRCGVYFSDHTNMVLEVCNKKVLYLSVSKEENKKVYCSEEHLIGRVPDILCEKYEVLKYYVKNFGINNKEGNYSNYSNYNNCKDNNGFGYNYKDCKDNNYKDSKDINCNNYKENLYNNNIGVNDRSFVMRVKRVENGLLFGQFNNIFVFDFVDGNRVVIYDKGRKVYCCDVKGVKKMTENMRVFCMGVLESQIKKVLNNKYILLLVKGVITIGSDLYVVNRVLNKEVFLMVNRVLNKEDLYVVNRVLNNKYILLLVKGGITICKVFQMVNRVLNNEYITNNISCYQQSYYQHIMLL
ncbi:hypothetical protein CWI38_1666p0010, partial [Hamiltosporidium tvaerminnensis]